MDKKRKIKDILLQILTYVFSSFGVLTLVAIIAFVFSNGVSSFSFEMLVSDYNSEVVNLRYEEENLLSFEDQKVEGYYSKTWGIALKDDQDNVGEDIVVISYIDINSPIRTMNEQNDGALYTLKEGSLVTKIVLKDKDNNTLMAFSKYKAQTMVKIIDQGNRITDMQITTKGGGIRGSLLTTLLLIVVTLLIALPLGIFAAIFLSEYAKKNKFTYIIRTLIDMISGIPSIIFGLVGATIFIPFVNAIAGSSGTSVLAGALTLSIMLLPIIIKTVEEYLHTIPKHYRDSSLALGASKTQTIFKVILPNSIGGILAATLLSIGKIIGESAALIYTMGTAIKDIVRLNSNSTSLAVHIWSIMGGENPNYGGACAISIIILIVVLILNILIKLISKKLNRFEVKN